MGTGLNAGKRCPKSLRAIMSTSYMRSREACVGRWARAGAVGFRARVRVVVGPAA